MVSHLWKRLLELELQARVVCVLQPLAQTELSVFQCQLLPRDCCVLSEGSCFSDTLRIRLPTLPHTFSR